jgi:membrane protein DedA with SNARE-associated domain
VPEEELYHGDGPAYLEIPSEVPDAQPVKEWWDDPSLPWKHKPTRTDIACIGWISFVAVFSLVMLPLQPVMLGLAPQLLGSLGYRTGLVITGALASEGDPWWPLVLFFGSLMAAKFDWVYWWAGKLWGRGLIEVWSGKSARARKRNERAERIARKYETLAIVITYLPIPIPAGVIYAVLGEAGTSLKKFLTVDLLSSLGLCAIYVGLGWYFGEPVVAIMEVYMQYMWYIAIAMLVGVVVFAVYSARKNAKAVPVEDGDEGGEE